MVLDNVVEYMNSRSTKTYNRYQASAIQKSIKIEYEDRRLKNININSRTSEGKQEINKRIANIANTFIPKVLKLDGNSVKLFRECQRDEYTDRTKKCAWGFKTMCVRLGYDPDTRMEISN